MLSGIACFYFGRVVPTKKKCLENARKKKVREQRAAGRQAELFSRFPRESSRKWKQFPCLRAPDFGAANSFLRHQGGSCLQNPCKQKLLVSSAANQRPPSLLWRRALAGADSKLIESDRIEGCFLQTFFYPSCSPFYLLCTNFLFLSLHLRIAIFYSLANYLEFSLPFDTLSVTSSGRIFHLHSRPCPALARPSSLLPSHRGLPPTSKGVSSALRPALLRVWRGSFHPIPRPSAALPLRCSLNRIHPAIK